MSVNNGCFTGFGFGPIQAGLFLLEAQRGGGFDRLTVAEVNADRLAALNAGGGRFRVNIAHSDGIEVAEVGPVNALNPNDSADRERLVQALASSDVIVTALPSVSFYTRGGEVAVSRLLAEAAERRRNGPEVSASGRSTKSDRGEELTRRSSGKGTPVVYCAENNTRAASLLRAAVEEELRIKGLAEETDWVPYRFADTVIGKMSSVVPLNGTGRGGGAVESDAPAAPGTGGGTTGLTLEPFADGTDEAFLVEAFNAIEVSHPSPTGFGRFRHRSDLHPFEEAKLYGHNAVHALAGYLARELGLTTIADCPSVDGFIEFLREAFVEESGRALCRRYGGVDTLFTDEGFREYANDLLARMTNPYLADRVERVIRDPVRKLGWNDRLIGTLRLCLHNNVRPDRFAMGAAAALSVLLASDFDNSQIRRSRLLEVWKDDVSFRRDGNTSEAPNAGNSEVESVLACVERGSGLFLDWRESLAGRAPAERGAPRITPRL